jgi:hypothetical protein
MHALQHYVGIAQPPPIDFLFCLIVNKVNLGNKADTVGLLWYNKSIIRDRLRHNRS